MHFKYFGIGLLPLSSALLLSGCVVHEYPAAGPSPYAGKVQRVTGANYVIHASANPNLCFDVRGDKAAANQELWLYNCHGKENQRFAFVDKQGDTSNVTGIGGLCVDVHGGATADGSPVNVYPCGNDQPNQVFRHFQDGRIHEVQSHKCLTANPMAEGTHITIATCDQDNANQVWILTQ
jgi:hypothetical protein